MTCPLCELKVKAKQELNMLLTALTYDSERGVYILNPGKYERTISYESIDAIRAALEGKTK